MPVQARAAAVAVVAALVAVGVAGCSDPQEKYCSTLADEKQTLADLSGGAGAPKDGVVTRTVQVFQQLRDAAPDDVADEWDTYLNAWTALRTALDDAGAQESAFRDGKRPPGMSQADYDAISEAAADLRSTRVVEAASGIEQHARDVCKIDLGGSTPVP